MLRGRDGGLVLAHGPEVPDDAPPLDDALALAGPARPRRPARREGARARGWGGGRGAAGRPARAELRQLVLAPDPRGLRRRPSLRCRCSLTYPEDRLGVAGSRLLRPVVRPALAAMRALSAAPPARLAGRDGRPRGDAELVGRLACGGRRVPRAGRGRLRLDGERAGARTQPRCGGRRRYHQRRSADPRPVCLTCETHRPRSLLAAPPGAHGRRSGNRARGHASAGRDDDHGRHVHDRDHDRARRHDPGRESSSAASPSAA